MSRVGRALDGDVYTCCCWLPTIHSSFMLVSAPHWGQLGDGPHVALILQGKAGPSLGSRKWILIGPKHVLTAPYPGVSDWQVSWRRKLFLFVHRCYLGGALLSHWTRMPSPLLAAILWPRGEAVLGRRRSAEMENRLLGYFTELLTKLC